MIRFRARSRGFGTIVRGIVPVPDNHNNYSVLLIRACSSVLLRFSELAGMDTACPLPLR